jgi:Uma2 family endonuclease
MVDRIYPPHEMSDPAHGEIVVAEGVSFENFLKYFGEQHAEWLVGKVIIVSNNVQHQAILLFLSNLIDFFLGFKPLGRLLLAGVPMKIWDDRPAREPDLIFVATEHLNRIKPTYLDGAADMVVEIVSPESTARDRGVKLVEYEAAGIPEYWLLDPLHTEAVVYVLGKDGLYHPNSRDAEGRLVSVVLPGLTLHPDVLWGETFPQGMELVALVQAMVSA